MPSKNGKSFYWDSCVFLAGIEGEIERAPIVEQLLEEADVGGPTIWTSILSMTEVCFARSEQRRRALSVEVEASISDLWAVGSPVKTVEIHELLAVNAHKLIRKALERGHSLKPPDALHLATAISLDVDEFHTYDRKLFKFGPLTGLKILPPWVEQLTISGSAARRMVPKTPMKWPTVHLARPKIARFRPNR